MSIKVNGNFKGKAPDINYSEKLHSLLTDKHYRIPWQVILKFLFHCFFVFKTGCSGLEENGPTGSQGMTLLGSVALLVESQMLKPGLVMLTFSSCCLSTQM